ncbi:MAG: MarR family transcriptional regulator [Alphaproteobacteria bacterium]|nr:MAG: MarR family transcriptional regulator [Alphaproteobacteria bacterium]
MSGLERERLRAWLRLLRKTRAVEARLREALKAAHGTTLPRFDVLAALDRHREGLRMSDLSRHLMVSNGNVTGIVDRLEEDGLVERVEVEGDRRAMRVRLTPAGAARFAAMAADHAGWIDAAFARLGAAELAQLTGLLERIGEEAGK